MPFDILAVCRLEKRSNILLRVDGVCLSAVSTTKNPTNDADQRLIANSRFALSYDFGGGVWLNIP
jgi:hypothetical protein